MHGRPLTAFAVLVLRKASDQIDAVTSTTRPAGSEIVDDATQLLVHLIGRRRQVRIPDDREHPGRIHRRYNRASVIVVDNHVAGQEQADADLLLQRLIGKRRVAGAEDHVVTEVDAELLLQFSVDVDLAEHAEALDTECLAGALDCLPPLGVMKLSAPVIGSMVNKA